MPKITLRWHSNFINTELYQSISYRFSYTWIDMNMIVSINMAGSSSKQLYKPLDLLSKLVC